MKKSYFIRIDNIADILFYILIPIYLLLRLKMVMNGTNVVYCYNDIYSYAHEKGLSLLLPLAELVIINKIKYEFRISIIIRMKNIEFMWLRIIKKVAECSLKLTLYFFSCTTLFAACMSQFECNWSNDNSNAYYVLQRHVDIGINTAIIVLIFICIVFTEIFVMGLVISSIWWWAKTPIYGYMIMIILMILENVMSPSATNLFFSRMSIACGILYYDGLSLFNYLIFPILSCILLVCTGLVLFRKKDMLNGEDGV